jgi:hypothetical protein
MSKLTRYTSFDEMKSSKNFIQPKKSSSEREADFKEFIALVRKHSHDPAHSKSDTSLNQSKGGE